AYQLPMFYRSESEIFLYEIGVIQQHRKKGVAKSLIEHLKRYCEENSIKVMFVMTTMDNEPAKKLYENTGGELEVVPLYSYSI
ncbi:MAG: GNAT family N-acetyltransferase, partial [bacterium]|nr:GNAT family N-acetyltransferase [bacterium]